MWTISTLHLLISYVLIAGVWGALGYYVGKRTPAGVISDVKDIKMDIKKIKDASKTN